MTLRICHLVLPFAFLVALVGCGHNSHKGGSAIAPSKVKLKRSVELTQAKQEKLTSVIETVGVLDAECQTDIAAGVSGVVEEVLFREGDWVIKDETLLVRVEPRKYRALLAQAEANLNKAKASVKRAEATAQRGEAAIRDAEQTLELRKTILANIRRAGRGAKEEERQEAQASVSVAAARLDVAKSEREVYLAELEAAKKEVEATFAMRDLAEHNLRRSEVRAPFTGQINTRKVTRGVYLEDKTVICTMADLSRLRLVGYIPEKATPLVRQMLEQERQRQAAFLAGNLTAGPWTALGAITTDLAGETPAQFRLKFNLRPFPKEHFYGRIFFLSTVASPDTHLFECKAEVPTRGRGLELRPGFTARIECPLPGRPTSVVIPEESVRATERGFVAFRPKEKSRANGETEYVAEEVMLNLGQRQPGWVEVLEGLHAGDWVVRKGAEALEKNTPLAIPTAQLPLLQSGR